MAMLHEKPVLVALAVSYRSSPTNGLTRANLDRRTVSPSSAASTSSADSAIGTTSPSSASSISPGGEQNLGIQIAYAIQNEHEENAEVVEINVNHFEEDLNKVRKLLF